ncbi:MAG: 3-oxoacyl-ACP reductase [Myxococcales bacterium]|nr:3-oxoacyl-ACP reductase [Myxococcales bacterium]
MADLLLQLASSSRARRVVRTLGLPIPMPTTLVRGDGPWQRQPLAGRSVVVAPGDSPLRAAVDDVARAMGAEASGERPWAAVFDATGLEAPEQLRGLFDAFQPLMKTLATSGRLVVLGRPVQDVSSVAEAATQRALEGFVKSCGREVGRRGATANLVQVQPGAEERLQATLRFLLSPRSAFVSGQPLRVDGVCAAPPRVPLEQPLAGKVALVTGAARGIGRAIAGALSREGAQVVILDRPDDAEEGEAVAREVGGRFLGCDVTAPDAAATVAAHLRDGPGHVDVVVHNAGVTRDKTLAKMRPEQWDLTLAVNLSAIVRLTEGLDPLIADHGRIVCLSSIAGLAGNVGQTNYAASKAGVIGFVQALAPRVAERGIAVNAIAPGFIETRMTKAIPAATREVARRLSNLAQGGLPTDVAEVATFLSSPGASGLTGQTLRVCGGNFVGR